MSIDQWRFATPHGELYQVVAKVSPSRVVVSVSQIYARNVDGGYWFSLESISIPVPCEFRVTAGVRQAVEDILERRMPRNAWESLPDWGNRSTDMWGMQKSRYFQSQIGPSLRQR